MSSNLILEWSVDLDFAGGSIFSSSSFSLESATNLLLVRMGFNVQSHRKLASCLASRSRLPISPSFVTNCSCTWGWDLPISRSPTVLLQLPLESLELVACHDEVCGHRL